MISADWSNYIWKVTGVFFFLFGSSSSFFVRASVRLLFFCCDEWAQGQNGVYPLIWPASPDMGNAHSRWHYFGVCTRCATTPFISCELKFTTYPLTEGVNSSNMTQALILLGKQEKTCLSLSTFLDKENNKQSCFLFSLYILLNKSENLKSGLKIWGNFKKIPNELVVRVVMLTLTSFLYSVQDYQRLVSGYVQCLHN